MTTLLEKSILDRIQQHAQHAGYVPSPQEQQCLTDYKRASLLSALATAGFFGYAAYKLVTPDINAIVAAKMPEPAAKTPTTVRVVTVKAPRPPVSIAGNVRDLALTVGALSGTALVATYYSARWASTGCLACLLKTSGGDQKLGDLVQDMLVMHHPNAKRLLEAAGREIPPELVAKQQKLQDERDAAAARVADELQDPAAAAIPVVTAEPPSTNA
ncbi:hypothetical protein AMAG_13315 [Allomyces macrogynus ATCC 38327]|uniref:Uncharacterized protein n=1 Tax=Allomyces macrogynus (strain ATCC 38327) TaxID=578462 RepID=A0A0L0T0H6_ALLM3|nr:hypothetical protein AMAG_13315 [Allomyces macrogynus ATCC 38327]|eukprot:KNE68150.1 hypothetical protein AMAG_13315 [Allomyces macrogynus ATCC 38327]